MIWTTTSRSDMRPPDTLPVFPRPTSVHEVVEIGSKNAREFLHRSIGQRTRWAMVWLRAAIAAAREELR